MLFKRKIQAQEVGNELAKVAFEITEDEAATIQNGVDASNVPFPVIRREYLLLKIYVIQTVAQNALGPSDQVIAAFDTAVQMLLTREDPSGELTKCYPGSVERYDTAWQDPKGVGWSISMTSAFADSCREEDYNVDVPEILFVAMSGLQRLSVFGEFVKSLRIVG